MADKWSHIAFKDRLMILLTAGILLMAAVTAYIFLKQANVMQGQLDEMQGGSNQTEQLIILNKGQLTIAARNAANTHDLAVEASRQSTNLANAVREEHAMALAAQEANRNAIDSERPWIGVVAVNATPMEPEKEIAVKVIITNSGRRPARITRFRAASNVMVNVPERPALQPVDPTLAG
jgi:hypothetical protein